MTKFEGKYIVQAYLEYKGLHKRRYFNTKTATMRYVTSILGKYYRIKIDMIEKDEVKRLRHEIK